MTAVDHDVSTSSQHNRDCYAVNRLHNNIRKYYKMFNIYTAYKDTFIEKFLCVNFVYLLDCEIVVSGVMSDG